MAIARVLLAEPTVPVLDEATTALDPEAQVDVVGAYREVLTERTTVVITHREEILWGVDRVVEVGGGGLGASTGRSLASESA